MKKIGIIDLGSNTARLVIYAYEPGKMYKLIDQVRERVRLAEGIGADGAMREEPMRRAVEAVTMFKSLCTASGVDQIVSLATSATRDASNQARFIQRVYEKSGVTLRVLSGEEEAYYGYLGMVNSFPYENGFMFDLGGGSIQVTEMVDRHIRHSLSLPLGAVRMSERFFTKFPPSKKQIEDLRDHVEKQLSRRLTRMKSAVPLLASGGTARALAILDQTNQHYPVDRVHGYELKVEALDALIKEMSRKSLSELEKMPGMNEERTDVILGGALVIRELLRVGKFDSMIVSSTGLREGAFFEQFVHENTTTTASPSSIHSVPLIENPRQFSIENMGQIYGAWNQHAFHVCKLALNLFDNLKPLHGFGAWEREVLSVGALLHDIGYAIGYYNHDKHAQYLIENSELPAFTHREIVLIGMITRYHRKGEPSGEAYKNIFKDRDVERAKLMAGIVRVAEYLERGRRQIVRGVTCFIGKDNILVRTDIAPADRADATMELWEAQRHSSLLAQTLGREIHII
jgi:exopolyphosphatase/guanosine-5'-triphosphate,3'-diphosphate pyrophosphatase